jgi:ankyrin repeat protein
MAAKQTPDERLIEAVRNQDLAAVNRALEDGADPNSELVFQITPLAISVDASNSTFDARIVRELLARGADPNGAWVITLCRPELLQVLIDAGGHVDGPNQDGEPLFDALLWRASPTKIDALLDAGARVNSRTSGGKTVLMQAARKGQLAVVRRLLELGAQPTDVDHAGRTALIHAIEALSEAQASEKPLFRSIVGLLQSIAPGQPEDLLLPVIADNGTTLLEQMFDEGLDPNHRVRGAIRLVGLDKTLPTLKAGRIFGFGDHLAAPVEPAKLQELVGGTTPLMWAVALDRPDIVRLLLSRGADGNLETTNGTSACQMSIHQSNLLIKRLLGTDGVDRSNFIPGTQFSPNPQANCQTADSRAGRLGIDRRDTEDRVYEWTDLPAFGWWSITKKWSLLSTEHVREDKYAEVDAAKEVLNLSGKYFSAQWPKTEKENWMRAYPRALAAASLLRDTTAATALAKWIEPSRPRGQRSTYYNEQYFYWPLYQIWAAHLLGTKPLPAWRKMVESERPRTPKVLLEATDALLARDGKRFSKSLERVISVQKKATFPDGKSWAQAVLSPSVCWLASEAARAGIQLSLKPDSTDWVITEL